MIPRPPKKDWLNELAAWTYHAKHPKGYHFPYNHRREDSQQVTVSILEGWLDSGVWCYQQSQAQSQIPSGSAGSGHTTFLLPLVCSSSEHICRQYLTPHTQWWISHSSFQSSSLYHRMHEGPCSYEGSPAWGDHCSLQQHAYLLQGINTVLAYQLWAIGNKSWK